MVEKLVTISKLAKLLNTTHHTIRHYEDEGLLSPAKIASNGYRLYGMAQAYRLSFILFLRQLDLPVAVIKQVLQHHQPVNELLTTKKAEIQAEKQRLNKLEQVIDDQLSINQSVLNSTLTVDAPIYLQLLQRLPFDQDFSIAEIMNGNWNPDFMLRKIYYVITPDYYEIYSVSNSPTKMVIQPGTYHLNQIKAKDAHSFDVQLAPILKQQNPVIALEDRHGFLTSDANLVVNFLTKI